MCVCVCLCVCVWYVTRVSLSVSLCIHNTYLILQVEGYETWQCIRDHECATDLSDPWFCFVYHETNKVFTPWGPNAQLKLFSTP